MGVLGAVVVGFVAGIALAILLDEALGFDGRLWDMLAVLIGLGGSAIAVRLVHLRSRPRNRHRHRHRHRHA